MDPGRLAPWGDVRVRGRLAGGTRNEVWAVRLGERQLVARVSARSPEAVAWELELMTWLRAHGLRTPAVVRTTDGRATAGSIVVTEMIEGERPSTTAHWRAVARYLHELHARTVGWRQRPGFLASGDLLTRARGGDVDLDAMPGEAVERCRAAWAAVRAPATSVVHGDPGASNVFVAANDEVVLVDWDEARVDVPVFDLAALPDEVSGLAGDDLWRARQAASAWEAAVSWRAEPDYARRRLAEVAAG